MATTRTKTVARPPRRPKARDDAARWTELTAADVMQTEVVTVTVDTTMAEVERVFAEHRIGGVPVVDQQGKIVGVLSVRDLVARYAEDADAPPRTAGFYGFDAGELDLDGELDVPAEDAETAGSLMTREVLSVATDAPLRDIAKAMVRHGVHRLLVTDRGRTAGIVTTMDLLGAAAR